MGRRRGEANGEEVAEDGEERASGGRKKMGGGGEEASLKGGSEVN